MEKNLEEMIDRFFKGEIWIMGKYVGYNGPPIPMSYEPDKYLYYVSEAGVTILPKGGWAILDALVPEILKNIEGPIVEIGMGESSTVLADHAHQQGRILYSCDVKMGGIFNVFEEPLFEEHICYIGRSEEFIKTFDGVPAVVFIDGEHTYETVKMEVDYFLPILAEGGVLFMHDTFPFQERLIQKDDIGCKPGDIYKVRQELERNPDIDVLTWPYTALNVGLTMVLKHKPNSERGFWLRNGRV